MAWKAVGILTVLLGFVAIGLFLIGVSLLPAGGGAPRTSRTLTLREG